MNSLNTMFQVVKSNPVIFAVILVALVAAVIMMKKMMHKEGMASLPYSDYKAKQDFVDVEMEVDGEPAEGMQQEVEPTTAMFNGSGIDFEVTGEDILPLNLLPVSPVSGETVLNGEGSLDNRNFLTSTSGFGIDTIGSSKRLSTYDIRGEPTVTVNLNTSPFYQSTHTGNPYQRNMVME